MRIKTAIDCFYNCNTNCGKVNHDNNLYRKDQSCGRLNGIL